MLMELLWTHLIKIEKLLNVRYFSLIKSVCYLLPQGADAGQLSEETWNFLHSVHGGGPLVTVRPNVSHPELEASSQSKEKI